MNLQRGYCNSTLGQLHFCQAGSGRPLLLLHQTPRSMDEFADVIPGLAERNHVIAMDMVGFGMSPPVEREHSIELMARGALELMDGLGIDRFAVLGHHTGGAVAVELAASQTHRVSHVVLSSAPWTDATFREQHADGPGVDEAEVHDDGTHLTTLWSLRAPFYPQHRPDILNRFIRDALAPGVDPREGHKACARYEMERRIGLITAPTLLVGAELDPFALPEIPALRRGLISASSVTEVIIPGGMIPLMEGHPENVIQAVQAFLDDHPEQLPRLA
jgi:pimeloyl-ACP methyl ester carboxylesterase